MYNASTWKAAIAAVATLCAISACSDGTGPATLAPDDPLLAAAGVLLIDCPARAGAETQADMDASGGVVRLGGHEMRVPAGAIAAPTRFRMAEPATRGMELTIRAGEQASFQFRRPVTVTLDYSRCHRADLDRGPLTVWKIDPATRQLLAPLGGVDDKATRTITFETGTLSTFSIAR